VVAEAPESTTKHLAKIAEAVASDNRRCGGARLIVIIRPRLPQQKIPCWRRARCVDHRCDVVVGGGSHRLGAEGLGNEDRRDDDLRRRSQNRDGYHLRHHHGPHRRSDHHRDYSCRHDLGNCSHHDLDLGESFHRGLDRHGHHRRDHHRCLRRRLLGTPELVA